MSENSTETKENYSDHQRNLNLQSVPYWLVNYPSAVIQYLSRFKNREG